MADNVSLFIQHFFLPSSFVRLQSIDAQIIRLQVQVKHLIWLSNAVVPCSISVLCLHSRFIGQLSNIIIISVNIFITIFTGLLYRAVIYANGVCVGSGYYVVAKLLLKLQKILFFKDQNSSNGCINVNYCIFSKFVVASVSILIILYLHYDVD